MSEKPELKDNERYCFKCKRVVKDVDFNNYFKICQECEENTGTGH